VTIRRGDTVRLTVFVVNGDAHEVWVAGPDGQRIVESATWNRGREYHLEFVATNPGTYQLVCSTHAPTMTASFVVLGD
jgi:plastocyanin